METIDYNRLYEIFSRYSAHITLDVDVETRDVGFSASALQYQLVGRVSVKMSSTFSSQRGFDQFAKDMIHLDEMSEEAYLRHHNPTLQRAYDEYQLLLKLTR